MLDYPVLALQLLVDAVVATNCTETISEASRMSDILAGRSDGVDLTRYICVVATEQPVTEMSDEAGL
ncbi:hypothetical protein ACFPT7_08300 [Acidicapsa dinghuensis]|uniref:Uncharacterized protein n=1 Tax=Acidicapsa dinghuensis TaxID=2218256 RepID=A0ABW1EEJ3_9BACT|nr:hypothetical protein [Acidicapsa dinghuensis]